jgi:hypothetical protein
VPSLLNGLKADGLIQPGQSDQTIDQCTKRGDLAKLHSKDGGHQIKMRDGYQSPVERAHDDQNCCSNIQLLHDDFLQKLVDFSDYLFNYKEQLFNSKENEYINKSRMTASQIPAVFLTSG